ncbi:MAG: STAS/SEC14 domain-containing protein [Puniceicoccaceae bacterium]|nr:MAG: STAS/SEC14 domain-containing protein [Puniceicoccaceae bacterium]
MNDEAQGTALTVPEARTHDPLFPLKLPPHQRAMPLVFNTTQGIGCFRAIGEVEFAQGSQTLQNGLRTLVASKQEPYRVLFDLTRSAENRTGAELQEVAHQVRRVLDHGRLALVADKTLFFGLSRLFSAYAEYAGFEVGIFGTEAEAVAWLLRPTEDA